MDFDTQIVSCKPICFKSQGLIFLAKSVDCWENILFLFRKFSAFQKQWKYKPCFCMLKVALVLFYHLSFPPHTPPSFPSHFEKGPLISHFLGALNTPQLCFWEPPANLKKKKNRKNIGRLVRGIELKSHRRVEVGEKMRMRKDKRKVDG